MQKHTKIILIGAGKVATHIGQRLVDKGVKIVQVVNRSAANATALAEKWGAVSTTDFGEVLSDADCYIIATADTAISMVAESLVGKTGNGLVVHTSGATPGAVLHPFFARCGVFYPVQTFTLGSQPNWRKIPLCVDARSEMDRVFLEKLARTLGAKPTRVTDEQRAQLHVAAVFANNFTNHCCAIAEKILQEHDLPFALLKPLIEETMEKALQVSPATVQTGPAQRGDVATMERHLGLLAGKKLWKSVYEGVSESIVGLRK